MTTALLFLFVLLTLVLAEAYWIERSRRTDAERRAAYWMQQQRESQQNAFVWYDAWQDAVWGRMQREMPAELFDADRRPGWRTPHA